MLVVMGRVEGSSLRAGAARVPVTTRHAAPPRETMTVAQQVQTRWEALNRAATDTGEGTTRHAVPGWRGPHRLLVGD